MQNLIGLDIGGTKIAAAVYAPSGRQLQQIVIPSPNEYGALLGACLSVIADLERVNGVSKSVGVGTCGVPDPKSGQIACAANLPCIAGKPLKADLERALGRVVTLANDANCAALAEAVEGAGKGFHTVFSLILGTGVGGGFVVGGRLVCGANGICGEIGHLPLPSYDVSDGDWHDCKCGRKGCVETFISGAGLSAIYLRQTGQTLSAKEICQCANEGATDSLAVLDKYFTLVAKSMTLILHTFDPDIIVVSGGLSVLPGLYDEVPKRWGRYALANAPLTRFVPPSLGAMAGLRGAALL